jgi:hypothetical protein
MNNISDSEIREAERLAIFISAGCAIITVLAFIGWACGVESFP